MQACLPLFLSSLSKIRSRFFAIRPDNNECVPTQYVFACGLRHIAPFQSVSCHAIRAVRCINSILLALVLIRGGGKRLLFNIFCPPVKVLELMQPHRPNVGCALLWWLGVIAHNGPRAVTSKLAEATAWFVVTLRACWSCFLGVETTGIWGLGHLHSQCAAALGASVHVSLPFNFSPGLIQVS